MSRYSGKIVKSREKSTFLVDLLIAETSVDMQLPKPNHLNKPVCVSLQVCRLWLHADHQECSFPP